MHVGGGGLLWLLPFGWCECRVWGTMVWGAVAEALDLGPMLCLGLQGAFLPMFIDLLSLLCLGLWVLSAHNCLVFLRTISCWYLCAASFRPLHH